MKYVPSALIGQMSGSQGSTVASHNRYGSYLRNRTIPVNPNSPAQSTIRALLAAFSQQWRILTAGQQTGWRSLSELLPRTDVQGQTIVLAGNIFYNSFNITRDSVSLARLDTAPALVEVPPSFNILDAQLSVGGPTMTLFPGIINGTATNRLLISATPALSAGITFVKPSLYRNITTIVGDTILASDVQAAYETIFGADWQTQEGMQISFRGIGVSDTGFVGAFQNELATIGP